MMAKDQSSTIKEITKEFGNDRHRLMDIALKVQSQLGYISEEHMDTIAGALGIPLVEVRDMVSFYSFFSKQEDGKNVIRLCDAVVEKMHGMDLVEKAFEKELGVPFGGTKGDITLKHTACIGMSDQPPAALINGIPVTRICPEDVPGIIKDLKQGKKYSAEKLSAAIPAAQVETRMIESLYKIPIS